MSYSKNYYAVIRKGWDNKWAADLYKDGKLFYRNWQFNWKTKRELVAEIVAVGVPYGTEIQEVA